MTQKRPLSEQQIADLRTKIAASRERGREMFPVTLEIEGQLATLVHLDVLEALLDEALEREPETDALLFPSFDNVRKECAHAIVKGGRALVTLNARFVLGVLGELEANRRELDRREAPHNRRNG